MPKQKPVSYAAIQHGTLQEPEYQRKEIAEYVEWQLNKGADKPQKVVHLEKLISEKVFGTEHVAGDVRTDE